MRKLFLLILIILSFNSNIASAGNPITSCLSLNGYTGFSLHGYDANLYFVRNRNVYQSFGEEYIGYIDDSILPTISGVNAWSGYDSVPWINSYFVTYIVLYDKTDMDYIEIRYDPQTDTYFAFAYENRQWYAERNGEKIYTYSNIKTLYLNDKEHWYNYHWGWHPCGAFIIKQNDIQFILDLIGEIQ